MVSTRDDAGALAARLGLALVLWPHGAQKLLGWFGGHGFSGTMDFFTSVVGLPWLIAMSVILLEFFGPVLLASGLAVRPVAAAIIGLMIGAIVTTHLEHGFFMNWFGNQAGEGYEFHLLVIALAVALMVQGAGKLSLDRRFGQGMGRAGDESS